MGNSQSFSSNNILIEHLKKAQEAMDEANIAAISGKAHQSLAYGLVAMKHMDFIINKNLAKTGETLIKFENIQKSQADLFYKLRTESQHSSRDSKIQINSPTQTTRNNSKDSTPSATSRSLTPIYEIHQTKHKIRTSSSDKLPSKSRTTIVPGHSKDDQSLKSPLK